MFYIQIVILGGRVGYAHIISIIKLRGQIHKAPMILHSRSDPQSYATSSHIRQIENFLLYSNPLVSSGLADKPLRMYLNQAYFNLPKLKFWYVKLYTGVWYQKYSFLNIFWLFPTHSSDQDTRFYLLFSYDGQTVLQVFESKSFESICVEIWFRMLLYSPRSKTIFCHSLNQNW